jgi:hypothetical protein
MYEHRQHGWQELKENDFVKLNLDRDAMTVDLTVPQEIYLSKLLEAFGSGDKAVVDPSVWINVQVISKDTNGNEVTDEFSIEIKGSSEDFSSVCDWELLSIAEANLMAEQWEYHIGASDAAPVYKDILVTTLLDGLA